MSTHYRRAERPHTESAQERLQRIVGDGSAVTAEQFAGMTVAERAHLFEVNEARYRQLNGRGDAA